MKSKGDNGSRYILSAITLRIRMHTVIEIDNRIVSAFKRSEMSITYQKKIKTSNKRNKNKEQYNEYVREAALVYHNLLVGPGKSADTWYSNGTANNAYRYHVYKVCSEPSMTEKLNNVGKTKSQG